MSSRARTAIPKLTLPILLGCLLSFGLTFASSTLAQNAAATIHVPADEPTIQDGIDAAQDGDLVLVAPGTYPEQILLSGKTITLASHFLTTGDESLIEQTIIDGGGNTVITIDDTVGDDTQIIGLTIQNGDDGIITSSSLQILNNRFTNNKDAIDYEGGGGVCRNNTFFLNRDDAIDLDGPAEVLIEDNLILDNNDDGIEIRLNPYNGPTLFNVIRNNVISGSLEDGIQIIDYDGVSDRVFLIEGNLITSSAMVGLGLMDNAETREDFRAASIPERIHVFNNTFVDNPYAITGGDNLIALNNLFVNASTLALKEIDGDSVVAYNLFWNNAVDDHGSNIDAGTTIFADPLLDADGRLLPGSPAIDAGTAQYTLDSGEVVLDRDPSSYSGSAPDLGAYESNFVSSKIALALIVSGTRVRKAEALDDDPTSAPLLHVEYQAGSAK